MASIKKLDPIVASRIAAGEVVERPASVLRELLDNSIDANSSKISVYLEQGGIKAITVIDDGDGMSAQDLVLACQSHATSKVYTLDDLFNLKTMGFRGEALSSIAACSKVTINSNGNRIIVDNGVQSQVLPGSISQGTSICMENLFENIQ
ncbi:MAG: ATP-binding protein, partial [Sphaerochaetaceae bacterium]|nr:ATP-binding protein [Sphaerochaetaceae bacterium]